MLRSKFLLEGRKGCFDAFDIRPGVHALIVVSFLLLLPVSSLAWMFCEASWAMDEGGG